MKATVLKYVVFIAGILLLGFVLTLIKDQFSSSGLFALDAVVLLLIYLSGYFSFGEVFFSAVRFGDKVASLGVLIAISTLYSFLALAGVAVGLYSPIGVEWQYLYQAAFLFFAIVGFYFSAIAQTREQAIHQQSAIADETMSTLLSKADILRTRALASSVATHHQKEQVRLLVDRIKFISYNPLPYAKVLDEYINEEMDLILMLLQSLPDTAADWEAVITSCNSWITDRTRMVITQ